VSRKWFEVDPKGLAEIAKRRGMAFITTEPIQNAWDEQTTRVEVYLHPVPKTAKADLVVRDDSPDGFRDLADSYMMFRQSYKLSNPEQRGRFNIGEKLLLSVAESARIESTKGSVIFDANGRRSGRKRTKAGSVLSARLKMTRSEVEEALSFAETLIPPTGIVTVINGKILPERSPVLFYTKTLYTEIAGVEGGFTYTIRKTEVKLYDPLPGEEASLYEMGIPVDKIDCAWHVNVMQKIPLSMDRSSVRFGYISRVQRFVAEMAADLLDEDEARSSWVAGALDSMEDEESIRTIVKTKFGRAVIFDPSAPESNKLALDAGYRVIHGREMSKQSWATIKAAKALIPAGRVFDSGQVMTDPDGESPVPRAEWTTAMETLADYAAAFSEYVNGEPLGVEFYNHKQLGFVAACGGGTLSLNITKGVIKKALKHVGEYCSSACLTEAHRDLDALLIHECAHVKAKDHLTHEYHRECCRIGAIAKSFAERL